MGHWKDQLRQERIRQNWRQQDLADQLGTTVVTVQRWERGSHQPSAYFRIKLCALFGKTAEELGFVPDQVLPPAAEEILSAPAEETEGRSPETTSALDLADDPGEGALGSASESPLLTSAPLSQEPAVPEPPPFWSLVQRRPLVFGLAWLANFLLFALTVWLGFPLISSAVPLFSSPLLSFGLLILAALFPLLLWLTLLFSQKPVPKENMGKRRSLLRKRHPCAMLFFGTSCLSLLLCFVLLLTGVFRFAWCPGNGCSVSPSVRSGPGVHDANLEIYPVAVQGTSFVIPGNPTSSVQPGLPQDVGAVRLDQQGSSSLYRVVIGVHSLVQGVNSLLIKQVLLVVEHVSLPPRPLNVWQQRSPVDYHTNPYLALYTGQSQGENVAAIYIPVPYANVQLAPGEADQLDIQLSSHLVVAIRFRLQILYRLAQESAIRTLTLSDSFEMVFSDGSNWHEYTLQSGHFVPTST